MVKRVIVHAIKFQGKFRPRTVCGYWASPENTTEDPILVTCHNCMKIEVAK